MIATGAIADLNALAVDTREDGVDQNRQGRGQQQADRAARRHQSEGEALGIAARDHRGIKEASDRDDCDRAASGERGEERARDDTDDGEAARHPSEERVRRAHDAHRSLGRGEHVAEKGKERTDEHQFRRSAVENVRARNRKRRMLEVGCGAGELRSP